MSAVPTLKAEGVERATPPGDAPVAEVAAGVARVGHALAERATTTNWVCSPLSLAYAFAMLRAGAGGETAAEIDRVLGFPAAGPHEAFNAITRATATPHTRVANGLFTQHGLPVGAAFLRSLATHYGSGVHPVDFARDGAEVINAWVDEATAGRIPRLFDALSPTTRLVLANAIYLKAEWRHPFAEAETTHEHFAAAGGPVRVPMMHLTADLAYAAGPGWQAVELPYKGADLALRLVVPADDQAPDALLAPDLLAAAARSLAPAYVRLAMPRFDYGSHIDLVRPMKALGLRTVFEPGADLGGIHPGLRVDGAVQRATVTVDEWGTEAAAATGLMSLTSWRPPPEISVSADVPFAFTIVHPPTGVPLFAGVVGDPSDTTGGRQRPPR
ncbi:serpin family protein [Phytohabitans sp. ZYX-F-186]|uniref:Serpin family protein n=1 Tax=Phytohabitans maris TaxID=3071409 RepID=A0ABU0ZDK4_9ACTN|nr:serpin family protein [Phytohabitans sp. ZYX-F-186]MDQ7904509.1 serpin family protein [Phytohabitans sp. ZYX-F-186]